jgi:uncharacterized membrane protein (DUF373 family)
MSRGYPLRYKLQGVAQESKKGSQLSGIVEVLERFVYYGVAVVLIAVIVMTFVSTVVSMLQVLEVGMFQTTLTVLDQVLLIFIFVELLNTIGIVLHEEIVAEPFLLVGLIAVVRRILSVTAQAEQTIGTDKFQDLSIELGVLAALVVALSIALYVTRRTRRRERSIDESSGEAS